MRILIAGAGGFIGGHLVKNLLDEGHQLICADLKPFEYWFHFSDKAKNFSLDLKEYENCLKVTEGVDFIYNMACNMGGMGFIENNKAECMLSVLVNTNLLRASLANQCKKYFFSSSACVYNASKQNKTFIAGLKETDAYPADPEDGYGWEKLFSERIYLAAARNKNMQVRIARYHNIFGERGSWNNGKEKAPAALCRKVAMSDINGVIDVWGDGMQTRSFLHVDECVEATLRLMRSDFSFPLNIGSDEMITINGLVKMIDSIAKKNIQINHIPGPLGVKGRNSDNSLYEQKIGWRVSEPLINGIERTYKWINEQVNQSKDDSNN